MGYIYLYTGDGAGKTTNALGLALRSLGHNHNVVIIQFMKWYKDTGENLYQWSRDNMTRWRYRLIQVGRKGWHGLDKLDSRDKAYAHKGLEIARVFLYSENPPNLLVLDEINLTASCGLITEEEVLKALENIPKNVNVVMTGRNAPKTFINRADFVNVIECTKMPKDFVCDEGIQY